MGLFDLLSRLVPGRGYGVDELARRLGMSQRELLAIEPRYREFSVPKRSGGMRRIAAPEEPLRGAQQRIRRRLLARLRAHPAAMGFERGRSIVHNAFFHTGKAVLVRMDLKDFFTSTRASRVKDYFRRIGWNRPASELLTRLCTYRDGLPQGAPTSPRLSNLVNYRLDARLTGLADSLGAVYTRYADDLFFSFAEDRPGDVRKLIHFAKQIIKAEGYQIQHRKKLQLRRAHSRQVVTGLVVNDRVNLPRSVRRWLRAVEHHLRSGRPATLSEAQLAGWRALERMVEEQRAYLDRMCSQSGGS